MRITSGTRRGHILLTPDNQDIRPTSDKVRLAMFNALYSRAAVQDAVVLDAFCGTGALGLEALSQGAQSCTFYDCARASLELAQRNAAQLKFTAHCVFRQGDVTTCRARPEAAPRYNLVFLDPPYHKNLVESAVAALCAGDWLSDDAWLVVETESAFTPVLSGFSCDFDKVYGAARVTFWQRR